MGHRASVAYVREDDTVQAHYSHWGALEARLAFQTTFDRERPYGAPGEDADRQRLLESLTSEERSREVFDYENLGGDRVGDVAEGPYDSFPDLETWAAEGVNFLHHEAAYVIDPRGIGEPDEPWPVRAFDTMWYKGPSESPDGWGDTGILVELERGPEWGQFAHGSDEDPAPDNGMEREDWVNAALEWLGTDTRRIPDFSPFPEDNRA
ncbi:hypothetical protein M197_gp87 [Haloarcula hispanica tailed virus 2]|uniref:Uncharacterized protein n=1 Tax=Haloarcula hispanica tailed virus 2 TaxID=1273751 RepID=R4TG93_9CAUD|nr:hypothetical protein M197_gp87 [Haloarcula hispanica tailed virus 2]AGM11251.1 hypothetical protein HHTV2_87 [Haloarcula hispanica tailed virus 2]